MRLFTCSRCGRPFERAKPRERRCPRCAPAGRAGASPSNRAQCDGTGDYERNREALLASDPPCALRLLCHGAAATTADHIVAVVDGGSHALSNLQPACSSCNSSKQNGRRSLVVRPRTFER